MTNRKIRWSDFYILGPWFVLLLISVAFFCSGCLVLSSKHLSKPLGPDQLVELRATNEYPGWVFHRYFNSNDFKLDMCVLNGENHSQIDFWFYIVPIPDSSFRADKPTHILTVEIKVEPTPGHNISFDPTRTYYSSTNEFRVPPARIWQTIDAPEYGNFRKSKNEIPLKTIPLSTNVWFILEYDLNNSPDIPFDLFIEGCQADEKPIELPRVALVTATIHRLEFKLPY